MEGGCQQNDSLADGHKRPAAASTCASLLAPSSLFGPAAAAGPRLGQISAKVQRPLLLDAAAAARQPKRSKPHAAQDVPKWKKMRGGDASAEAMKAQYPVYLPLPLLSCSMRRPLVFSKNPPTLVGNARQRRFLCHEGSENARQRRHLGHDKLHKCCVISQIPATTPPTSYAVGYAAGHGVGYAAGYAAGCVRRVVTLLPQ